jgi:UPF0042 nucleotide-binding protein
VNTSEPSSGADGAEKPPIPSSFVVITGLSGSGKSLVHRCFEDMGYFCVDNLPSELIPKFAEMKARSGAALGRVALTCDVRERDFLAQFPSAYSDLKTSHPGVTLLFLEADDATLAKRFSETRRPHPLGAERPLIEGIRAERELLAPMRALADLVLDTSEFTGHELRAHLVRRFGDEAAGSRLQVSIVSFAYRHGLPREADVVLDVRFLPNPFYVADLRPLSGRDEGVRRYLDARPEYIEFFARLTDLLAFLLPAYEKEGKSYLTLAIGCTGGRHRSVAIVEHLHEFLESRGIRAMKAHRDCDRDQA